VELWNKEKTFTCIEFVSVNQEEYHKNCYPNVIKSVEYVKFCYFMKLNAWNYLEKACKIELLVKFFKKKIIVHSHICAVNFKPTHQKKKERKKKLCFK
jgi:hypothetical protein